MKYEKQDYIEVAKLPYNIAKAVVRGIGRIVVQELNDFMYNEPDLSHEEWQRFEDEAITVPEFTDPVNGGLWELRTTQDTSDIIQTNP